ncbi:hypothetical protein CKO44_18590 [Rubrivivax gelatinosus]|uniref:Uncharacterized protein n=1 Tax=Rubrivivax gelatinosus TaxID=28068 RepID=A0ABS1DSX5_RUBGE|nr:hypothetical protein [Rubrivivax gelatinosus]MBK1615472.1 hypothetical protein [Rubrivivax gelatinosus]MBK1713124.1 hypothetical protein [Rubrivivax gelatinosus]
MGSVSQQNQNLYRVVEVVRDANGRLTKVFAAYHTDLAYVRRHAAFVAGYSVAARIYICDHTGKVIQRFV